jgi:predicted HTH domain antitoxin
MKSFLVELPEALEIDTLDVKFIIASKLYEQGKLSLGEGAKTVGVSKRTFVELLGKYNVSVFNYGIDELEEDIRNA